MGIFKQLFKGRGKPYRDKNGIYLYVRCDQCGSYVRSRIDKQHDLNRTAEGLVWHKTIVDSRCFRHIPVVVRFDRHYHIVGQEIEGGKFVSEADYEAASHPPAPPAEDRGKPDHG